MKQLVCHCGKTTCLTARSLYTQQSSTTSHVNILLMVTALVADPQVESLAKPQHRFKVDVNAGENHMTGAAVITDDFCLVIVEGGKPYNVYSEGFDCMLESHLVHQMVA